MTTERGSARRNYSLDRRTVERFENAVPKGARSRVLEELMAQRVGEIEATELRARIIAGLADMDDVYAETAQDWAGIDAEPWPAP